VFVVGPKKGLKNRRGLLGVAKTQGERVLGGGGKRPGGPDQLWPGEKAMEEGDGGGRELSLSGKAGIRAVLSMVQGQKKGGSVGILVWKK